MADKGRVSGGLLRQVHRVFCLGTAGVLPDGQALDCFITGRGEDSEAAFKELRLRDFKGKFVLLDFWATWCATCVAEIPNFKVVHHTFATNGRFAMLSLSLDESAADLRRLVRSQKISWSQALIGPDSAIAAAYDATAIPATFLIGPDGRILAKDFRGEKAKATVAEALKRD